MGPHVAGIRTALPSPFTLPLFQAPISDHSLWSLTSNIPFLPFILRWWSYFLFHWKHREREHPPVPTLTYIHCLPACHILSFLPVTGGGKPTLPAQRKGSHEFWRDRSLQSIPSPSCFLFPCSSPAGKTAPTYLHLPMGQKAYCCTLTVTNLYG